MFSSTGLRRYFFSEVTAALVLRPLAKVEVQRTDLVRCEDRTETVGRRGILTSFRFQQIHFVLSEKESGDLHLGAETRAARRPVTTKG